MPQLTLQVDSPSLFRLPCPPLAKRGSLTHSQALALSKRVRDVTALLLSLIHISAIEKAISLFLQKVQPKKKLLETAEFNDALSYVKTLKAKGGKPIPADENSLDALVDKKYAL